MRLLSLFAAALLTLVAAAPSALAKPPMEAFGDVPGIRLMEISPDGKKVAFLKRRDDGDVLFVYEFATKVSKGLVRISDIRARYLRFLGNDRVVIVASKDTRTAGFRGRYEASAAFSFDLNTGKYVQLLKGTKDIFPAQSGLGRILAVDPDGKTVYMPAYMGGSGSQPSFDLLQVLLDSGRGRVADGGRGTYNTIDWLTDSTGRVVLREDFSEKNTEHTVRARPPGGDWKQIYRKVAPLPEISVVGLSGDAKSVFTMDEQDSEFVSLYRMSIEDGSVSGPEFQRDDAEVEGVISDDNRVVHGVRYSGMYPRYEMFDKAIEEDINTVIKSLGGSSVYLSSWSQDWSKLLFFASGGRNAERYLVYDRAAKSLSIIATARPEITPGDVGEVVTMEYKARDGLKIPGLITWPTGVAEADRKNLPMIVMPHGGPESYDSVGFDWMAQFLANEGYVVIQPNFRGSAGFGSVFTVAGYGEWGRKMQDDITDGVDAMVRTGWADPERVCIVGWSYGGYAALAGGASTPDKYKCVASIAGVSDLHEMLVNTRRLRGAKDSSLVYWQLLIGDMDKDREKIDAVSPSRHADLFKAPVLLIHGASDTTVPISQSEIMSNALKNAKKPVEFIRIEGDDHGLVDNDSRRLMLTKLSEFLKAHIGK